MTKRHSDADNNPIGKHVNLNHYININRSYHYMINKAEGWTEASWWEKTFKKTNTIHCTKDATKNSLHHKFP